MNNKKYTLKVYNTITNEYEDVTVTEEIYITYRRTEWNLKKNEQKIKAKTIPLSSLKGGEDGAYENFNEFIAAEFNPELLFLSELAKETLNQAIAKLNNEEKELINALFFEGKSERDYAKKKGVCRNAVHKRKIKILFKLKNIFEN